MKIALNLIILVCALCMLACPGCSHEQSPPKAKAPEAKNDQPAKTNQPEVASETKVAPVAEDPAKPVKPSPVRSVMKSYYHDVVTGEMFIANADELPPIIRENGNQAFKVYIFTCGSCANEADRFVGYYEGFTKEYKEKLAAAIEAAKASNPAGGRLPDAIFALEQGLTEGRLLSVDGKNWVSTDSEEGIAINIALSKACDDKGGRLKPCFPGISETPKSVAPVPVP